MSDYLTAEGVPSYLQDRIVQWVEFNYVSTHKQYAPILPPPRGSRVEGRGLRVEG